LPPRKYDCRIDLAVDNAHTRVLRLVGTGKHVLELGCASGYMTRVLVEQFGCTVVGVEQDREAAEQARKVCRRLIHGDIDSLEFAGELGDERFDVILCADVLEHLRDPMRALTALRPALVPNGYVVASIPNVAHVAVIAELLEGRFPYGPVGLLDDTHLRFFTRHSIYETFERAGFVVSHLERLQVEPAATEFRTDLSRFPVELTRLLCSHADSTTYQFILTASPVAPGAAIHVVRDAVTGAQPFDDRGASILRPAPEDRLDAARGLLEAFLGRMQFLEAERDRQTREAADARGLIDHLRREVGAHLDHIRFLQDASARRDQEAAQSHRELDEARRQTELLQSHVQSIEQQAAALRGRLALIEASRVWRALTFLRRWR
jgi:2-polyprenyl-3-methyl-5-hydroxy-6-metoxy-1,4-benzoquinol methylase